MDFDIPWVRGRLLRRYLVRVQEMREANRIVKAVHHLVACQSGPVITDNHKVRRRRGRDEGKYGELIHHFKLFTEGMHVPARSLCAVEHQGRVGVYIISTRQQTVPLKLRAPSFPFLAALDEMSRGHMIADVVAIIGTQDIVFGRSTGDRAHPPPRRVGIHSRHSARRQFEAKLAPVPRGWARATGLQRHHGAAGKRAFHSTTTTPTRKCSSFWRARVHCATAATSTRARGHSFAAHARTRYGASTHQHRHHHLRYLAVSTTIDPTFSSIGLRQFGAVVAPAG